MDNLWAKLKEGTVVRKLAYFDTRDRSDAAVVFTGMHDERIKKSPICALLVYEDRELCTRLKYWTKTNNLSERYKEWYLNYMLRTTIPIPSSESPLYAMIGLGNNCTGLMYEIPIQNDQPKQRLTYGVCLHKGLFNLHDPQLLVDWVDLHIALGAEIINVYLQNVSESYYTLLKPYVKRGIVEVLDWNLKPPLIPGYTSDWGQSGVINECIYRNLYRVKYLALLDIDEFVIPMHDTTVMEMIRHIEKDNKLDQYATYSFYNTAIYDDGVMLPEVKSATKCKNITWPRYYRFTLQMDDHRINLRAKNNPFWFPKMIVKVAAINAAWYHWPKNVRKGFKDRYAVPWKYALLYHYRFPAYDRKRPKTKRSNIIGKYFDQTVKHLQCNK